MTYIVDLTLIMQNLFWLVVISGHTEISVYFIKIAWKAYDESTIKAQVHFEIKNYVKDSGVLAGADNALNKVIELIDRHRIGSSEMFRLKGEVGPFDASRQEPWDITESISGRR